jgi:putative sterol carrier protein
VADIDFDNLEDIEPQQFRQLVKQTDDKKIAELMSGEHRGRILDAIFTRFPSQLRADKAGDLQTVIHWVIGGAPDGGSDTYQLVIENGTCTSSATPDRDPRLTLTLGPVDFLKVVSGAGNPMMMFMTGKLKAKGDLGLATNLANLFNLPK